MPRASRQILVAALLALCLTAPAWLTAARYAPEALRADRVASAETENLPSASLRAEQRLVPLMAPNAFGNDRFAHYWGNSNINEDASGFVGTASLLLVLLGALRWLYWAVRRRSPSPLLPQEGWMWGVALVAKLVIALPPGLPELLRILPGGAVSDFHHRLLLPFGLAMVYVACCELERRRRAGRNLLSVVPLALSATLFAALLAWAYLGHPHPEDPSLLAIFREGWLRWQLRFLAGATGLLALAAWSRGRKRWLTPGMALLVAAELLLLHRSANPPMPPRLAFPSPPSVAYLQERTAEAQPRGEASRLIALGRAMPAHLGALYGLSDLRGAGPMAPMALYRALGPRVESWQGESPLYNHPEDEIYDRLAVRWVLSEPGLELPAPLVAVHQSEEGWVWERPNALPPLRLASAVGGLVISEIESARWSGRFRVATPVGLESALYQDGGWRVLVDGRRHHASPRAEGAFLSARLPAGDGRWTLLYRPPGLLLAALLAALGATFLLGSSLRPSGGDRRLQT